MPPWHSNGGIDGMDIYCRKGDFGFSNKCNRSDGTTIDYVMGGRVLLGYVRWNRNGSVYPMDLRKFNDVSN